MLFTGDVVYVDRLLGVIAASNTRNWLATFAVMGTLESERSSLPPGRRDRSRHRPRRHPGLISWPCVPT